MHLFDDGNGITADSRRFFRDHRHQLGDIVEAQVFFPGSAGPSPYACILGDTDGNKLWLSGFAAGYPGEGPRAAMEALVEVGFPAEQAREVFTHSPVRLRREPLPSGPHTTARADRQPARVLTQPDLTQSRTR